MPSRRCALRGCLRRSGSAGERRGVMAGSDGQTQTHEITLLSGSVWLLLSWRFAFNVRNKVEMNPCVFISSGSSTRTELGGCKPAPNPVLTNAVPRPRITSLSYPANEQAHTQTENMNSAEVMSCIYIFIQRQVALTGCVQLSSSHVNHYSIRFLKQFISCCFRDNKR